MTLNSKVLIAQRLFSQEVDNETIILDTESNEYFNLSGFGKVIWDMILEEKNLLEIHQELVEFTEIESEQLENDIISFIKSLEKLTLIEVKN